jgi:preprotein translocase subunit SecA
MTGTAQEVAGELWSVYRLPTATIPTHRPLRRRCHGEQLFATAHEKWNAVVERIKELRSQQRPVLVGTRSVAASELLSAKLTEASIDHVVLNARQDQEEAAVVAKAGESGRVTVATNMAGRGTDIKLQPGVAEAGGLHVLATERHEAARIDRQLYGRTGRQGDPGSHETMMSLEDDLMATRGGVLRWMTKLLLQTKRPVKGKVASLLVRLAQVSAERMHARVRRELLHSEEQLGSSLAFSGRME